MNFEYNLTCADCQYHSCNANMFVGCRACSGRCTRTRRYIKCNRHAHGCNYFKAVDWRKVLGEHLW